MKKPTDIPEAVDLRSLLPSVSLMGAWGGETVMGYSFEPGKDEPVKENQGQSCIGGMVDSLVNRILVDLVRSRPVLPKPEPVDYYELKNTLLLQVDGFLVAMNKDDYEAWYGKLGEKDWAEIRRKADWMEAKYEQETKAK